MPKRGGPECPPPPAAGTAPRGAPAAATCGRPGPPRAAQLLRAPGLIRGEEDAGLPAGK